MIKIATEEGGKEYRYVGTQMKEDNVALDCLVYLKEKGYKPDMVALAMRLLEEVKS